MSLAAALRATREIERVLRARSFALPAGRVAALTGIEERQARRYLDAMEAAGLVGSTPDLFDGGDRAGRPPRRRYFARDDSRTDPSGTSGTE